MNIKMSEGMVQHVVVDSGGFIKNAPLRDIGVHTYTLEDVIAEIRDKATKQRLQVLPYSIKFREPSTENIKTVTEFAKRTGDYRNLSATDIRVIALTYQLEKEHVGTEHLKLQPDRKTDFVTVNRPLEKATDIAGFYLKSKNSTNSRTTSECSSNNEVSIAGESEIQATHQTENVANLKNSRGVDCQKEECEENLNSSLKNNDINTLQSSNDDMQEKEAEQLRLESESRIKALKDGNVMPEDCIEYDDEDDDDDDDDDGWITPSNIKQIKEQMGDENTEKASVTVGCLTTDFAMQNVLIQMGLNVISIDGMLIKQARSYVLRCYGCFKMCTNMTKQFCPSCGNETLQRISMTVDGEGNVHYHMSCRKRFTTRGMKYSLPMPKGGKHGSNPILCDDQRLPQQRRSKGAKANMDVFDPDYVANTSPFAINDITSRAAQLGIHGNRSGHHRRHNPNEVRKTGRRK